MRLLRFTLALIPALLLSATATASATARATDDDPAEVQKIKKADEAQRKAAERAAKREKEAREDITEAQQEAREKAAKEQRKAVRRAAEGTHDAAKLEEEALDELEDGVEDYVKKVHKPAAKQVGALPDRATAEQIDAHRRALAQAIRARRPQARQGDLFLPVVQPIVKRVIAEEGDTVRIVEGRVYVNDIPLHDDYVPSEFRSHDDWGPQVIPEGYYFVMGDHRNNSSDSRHWGMVPKRYIIGKVQVRWWPVPTARVRASPRAASTTSRATAPLVMRSSITG